MFPSSRLIRWFHQLDDQAEKALKWLWRHRKLVGAVLAVAVAAWAIGATDDSEPPPDEARAALVESAGEVLGIDQVVNRLWVDRVPKSKDDKVRMYFLLQKKGAHPLGVHITFHSLTWRVQEFFFWKADKNNLELQFFDPEVTAKTCGKLEPVKGDEHVDMRLTLGNDPQTKGAKYTYFRLKERGAAGSLPPVDQLAAMLESLPVP